MSSENFDAHRIFGPPDDEDQQAQYPLTPAESFKLTDGQQAALDRLLELVLIRSPRTKVLLEGWAGTGKTFVINRVVEAARARQSRISFGMTAPTHKAVGQLRKHSEMKDQLDFGTIHSFLGLKEVQKKDPKNPHKQIVTYELDWESKNKPRRIDEIDVLIVDEASMLSDDLYGHIEDTQASRPNLVVIFMGDGLQIPPVGKKQETGVADAIPFVPSQRESRKIEHLVLSEIVRQKNTNPIIGYSAAIREQYKNQFIDWKVPDPSAGTGTEDMSDRGVEFMRASQGIEQLRVLFRKYFDSPEFEADTDHVKVIAWRNATVDYFNREIRLLINKVDMLPKIIDNEKLVLDKPIVKGERVVLPNNEELRVISHLVRDYVLNYKFIGSNAFDKASGDGVTDLANQQRTATLKVYDCIAETTDGKRYPILILHEDSESEMERIKKSCVDAAQALSRASDGFGSKEMWRQFFKLEKDLAQVKYNYCLTAHKSQGSTYNYCISMEWDIDQNRDVQERNRIRYVAATRARNKLFIVKA